MESPFKATFSSFVEGFNLSSLVLAKAENLLREVSSTTTQSGWKVEEKIWIACIIYVAVQDVRCPYGPCNPNECAENFGQPTVTQLLEKADTNIMDFFTTMCSLKRNHALSNNSKQCLIALERKYCIVSALYDKFEKMINEIFCADADAKNIGQVYEVCNKNNLQELVTYHRSLCWMLFLVAKAKVLWHRQELLATFHLLLCCMVEVIKVTPTFLLLPPFDGVAATSENFLAVLQVLSSHVNTNFDEVKIVYNNCWLHTAGELVPDKKLPQLMELKSMYRSLYLQSGDLDESHFLDRNKHLFPQSLDNSASPQKIPVMPVKRVLDTVQALHFILQSAPDDLSSALKACFQKCSKDPTPSVKRLVQNFKEKFIFAFVEAHEGGNEQLAQQRYKLAARFYYLMLDAMLKVEGERLASAEFTSLLHNETFHGALLACCTEVVIMACGSVGSVNFTPLQQGGYTKAQGIVFPWVLKTYNVKAYHFFKVIESFIKSAPTITQQIVKHLKVIEEKILETLAWQSDSPVFDTFYSSSSSTNCKSETSSTKSNPILWSPIPQSNQNSSSPRSSHALNIFLNKVSRLAYRRLETLCSLLEIQKETQTGIWTCIEHVIYQKTCLLKDRHLDQIIMCCVYAVCKVLDQEVRFKTIINCYLQLSHATDMVYKQVLTENKREFIIAFYNHQFTSDMKDYILANFSGQNKGNSSPSISDVNSPVVLSPAYSLPGKKNFFISPLRQSPFKHPTETVCQNLSQSYNIGEINQSSEKLRSINETLKLLQPGSQGNSTSKSKKRLQFDSDIDTSKTNDKESECGISVKKILKFDHPMYNKNNTPKKVNSDTESSSSKSSC